MAEEVTQMATKNISQNDPTSEGAPKWLQSVLEKLQEQTERTVDELDPSEPLGFV